MEVSGISDWPDRESKSLDHVIRKMTHSEGLNTAAYNELDRRPQASERDTSQNPVSVITACSRCIQCSSDKIAFDDRRADIIIALSVR